MFSNRILEGANMFTQKIRSSVLVLTVIAALTLAAFPVSADQPRMQAAKGDLENALKFLRQATADKGGHREKAIELAGKALTAVNNGIEYDRTHITVRPGRRTDAGSVEISGATPAPDQPNMTAARNSLNNAYVNLEHASADKGTYRVDAMNLIRQAIAEVDAGIEYDRTH
jgi:Tfp pilus assembly protein PilE